MNACRRTLALNKITDSGYLNRTRIQICTLFTSYRYSDVIARCLRFRFAVAKRTAATIHSKNVKYVDLPVVKRFLPDPVTVTAENQHTKLAETVTQLYHVPYEKQLLIKHQNCAKVLRQLGSELRLNNHYLKLDDKKLPCHLESVRPSPVLLRYRNKDEFSCGLGVDRKTKTVGFFIGSPTKTPDSSFCVEPTHLNIVKEEHIKVAQMFQEYIQASPLDVCSYLVNGHWKNLIVRSNKAGDIMAVVIMHPQQLTQAELQREKENIRNFFVCGPGRACNIKSLYFQACPHLRCSHQVSPFQLLDGQPHLIETLEHVKLRISPGTFMQVNTLAAQVLYETIADISDFSAETTVLDLGCGAGSISLYLARDVYRSVGIEQSSEAITDANFNKSLNDAKNTIFFEGQVSKVLPDLLSTMYSKELTVVANPSRGGLTQADIDSLRSCKHLGKVVYVSCKPTGNAYRNFVQLCQGRQNPKLGRAFVPVRAIPVDMFPQTDHCELIIVFERPV